MKRDPVFKIINCIQSAFDGNMQAQYILHDVGRDYLDKASSKCSKASLVFCVVGAPEVAAITSTIGAICDGALTADSFISGDYKKGTSDFVFLVAGIVIPNGVGDMVENGIKGGIGISIGKNGMYYQLGRSGALNSWEGFKATLEHDIANSVFGKLSPELSAQLISEAKTAYDKVGESNE